MNGWSTKDFQGHENTLYDTVMMDIYISLYIYPNP